VEDTQSSQALRCLGGEHGRAVVAHQSPRQGSLLQGLRQTVTELFGSLGQIPLSMTAQAGMIIDDPQHQWVNPMAFLGQDAQRTVMKIQMPQSIDILTLVTADLPSLNAMLGGLGAGTVYRTTARALDQALNFHEPQNRGIGSRGAEGRFLFD